MTTGSSSNSYLATFKNVKDPAPPPPPAPSLRPIPTPVLEWYLFEPQNIHQLPDTKEITITLYSTKSLIFFLGGGGGGWTRKSSELSGFFRIPWNQHMGSHSNSTSPMVTYMKSTHESVTLIDIVWVCYIQSDLVNPCFFNLYASQSEHSSW